MKGAIGRMGEVCPGAIRSFHSQCFAFGGRTEVCFLIAVPV